MHGTTHVVGILRRTFCVGELSLCMCGEENVWIAVEQSVGFVQIGNLWSLVFQGREVGVKVIGLADSEEGGVVAFAFLRERVKSEE